MPVIAVVNRKGGSGKSTLATHLAAHFANAGVPVMLGDVDKQQSTQPWLRARALRDLPHSAPIVGWAVDPKRVLRPPPGVTHVVLDTPGGLRGFDLARVVAFADVILMPVCNSIFDRESAADCFAELMALPRVASGRCKVAAVGMRVDARTKGAEVLEQWARAISLPFVGVLREAQAYVRCVEHGLTIFDLPDAQAQLDVAQWQPIVAWLEPVLRAVPRPVVRANPSVVRPAMAEAAAGQRVAESDAVLAPNAERAVAARPAAVVERRVPSHDLDHVAFIDGDGDVDSDLDSDIAVVVRQRVVPATDTGRAVAAVRPTVAPADAARPGAGQPVGAAMRAAALPASGTTPRPAVSSSTAPAAPAAARASTGSRLAGLFGWLTAPRFLHRNS